jgi:hypothetical protein
MKSNTRPTSNDTEDPTTPENTAAPAAPENTAAPAALPYVATAEEAAINLRKLRALAGYPDIPSAPPTHFPIAHEFSIPTRSPK